MRLLQKPTSMLHSADVTTFLLTGGEEVSCSMRGGIGAEALEEVEALLRNAFSPNSLYLSCDSQCNLDESTPLVAFVSSHLFPTLGVCLVLFPFICLVGLVAGGCFRLFRPLFLFYPFLVSFFESVSWSGCRCISLTFVFHLSLNIPGPLSFACFLWFPLAWL